ncbi:MAG: phosphatidate cytidylyltransferase [Bacteroidaceae bacterium]|nr:phosphatidate cytidylyltransferase [Bacteroidaceae bacterium]MBO4841239.1 phosphatidate cytidylyltransferase [Bacteroidaceae bacterium]
MKNLVTRTLTGLVYVVLLAGSTIYSPVTAFFFFGLVAAATLLEFGTVMNNHAGASMPRAINALAGFILVAAVWLFCIGSISAPRIIALWALLLLYIMVSELYRHSQDSIRNWSLALASQLYVALPFALLPLLSISRDEMAGKMVYTWIYPLALFVFLWVNDTFAYLSGLTLHKFFPWKLFPSVSPKKTWVGSTGGCLFTLLASVAIWHFQPGTLSLLQWLGFAAVVVVSGTFGDLVESHLKRQLDIKDSSHILPGHGGLLDRFDSSLLAIPSVTIYFLLL